MIVTAKLYRNLCLYFLAFEEYWSSSEVLHCTGKEFYQLLGTGHRFNLELCSQCGLVMWYFQLTHKTNNIPQTQSDAVNTMLPLCTGRMQYV